MLRQFEVGGNAVNNAPGRLMEHSDAMESEPPAYLEKVGASCVLVNLPLLVLGSMAWVISRWGASG